MAGRRTAIGLGVSGCRLVRARSLSVGLGSHLFPCLTLPLHFVDLFVERGGTLGRRQGEEILHAFLHFLLHGFVLLFPQQFTLFGRQLFDLLMQFRHEFLTLGRR